MTAKLLLQQYLLPQSLGKVCVDIFVKRREETLSWIHSATSACKRYRYNLGGC